MATSLLIENERGLSRRPLFPHLDGVYVAKLVTPARRYLVEASLGAAVALQREPEVIAYDRTYQVIGRVLEPSWDDLASLPQVVDAWDLWSGGDGIPGDSVWFEDPVSQLL